MNADSFSYNIEDQTTRTPVDAPINFLIIPQVTFLGLKKGLCLKRYLEGSLNLSS